jgi:hypothetical protein
LVVVDPDDIDTPPQIVISIDTAKGGENRRYDIRSEGGLEDSSVRISRSSTLDASHAEVGVIGRGSHQRDTGVVEDPIAPCIDHDIVLVFSSRLDTGIYTETSHVNTNETDSELGCGRCCQSEGKPMLLDGGVNRPVREEP